MVGEQRAEEMNVILRSMFPERIDGERVRRKITLIVKQY